MEPLLSRLKKGHKLIGDGAMGSMLMRAGLKSGQCPEELNLSEPELLIDIALQYFDAGADLIETNTFGGSPIKLKEYNLSEKAAEINIKAVEHVKKAVGNKAFISGSCGPCGKMLAPFGDADPEAVYKSFAIQLSALANAGADVFCIETMIDIEEAKLALKAAKEVAPDIPRITSLTYNHSPSGFHTPMGTDIATACAELQKAGADIIGSNCGNGVENMILIAQEYKKHTNLPIIVQANAGLPVLKDTGMVYPETAEFFASKVDDFVRNGASIIGGCCGTTPAHIRAMKNKLQKLTS